MNGTPPLKETPIKLIAIVRHQEIGLFHDGETRFEDCFIVDASLRREPARELVNGQNMGPLFAQPLIAKVENKTKIGAECIDPAGLQIPQEDFQKPSGITSKSRPLPPRPEGS